MTELEGSSHPHVPGSRQVIHRSGCNEPIGGTWQVDKAYRWLAGKYIHTAVAPEPGDSDHLCIECFGFLTVFELEGIVESVHDEILTLARAREIAGSSEVTAINGTVLSGHIWIGEERKHYTVLDGKLQA